MKILIVDKLDQYILELCLIITKSLGAVTVVEGDKSKLEKKILELDQFKLVIFNPSIFNRDDAQIFLDKIPTKINKEKIISRRNAQEFQLTHELNEFDNAYNLELIGNILNAQNERKPIAKFIPISLYKLLHIEPHNLGCDFYIKMQKTGKDHYVKRLHATDQFQKKEIENYLNLGLKEFYIPADQYELFINILTLELIKTYHLENKTQVDFFPVHCTTYEVLLERLKTLGVDELTRNLVEEFVKSVSDNIKNENEFEKLIENIKKSKHAFAFEHCYLSAIITYHLAVYYEWNSDTSRDTLLILSLFHDISLFNSEFSRIHTQDALKNLSDQEQKCVINHADDSAMIVDQFNAVPFGVSQLIREHHGLKDGIGFAKELSLNVSPLVMTFIVIEEFGVNLIEFIEKNPTKTIKEIKKENKKIVQMLEQSFSRLTYQKTVQNLMELMKKINFI